MTIDEIRAYCRERANSNRQHASDVYKQIQKRKSDARYIELRCDETYYDARASAFESILAFINSKENEGDDNE